MKSKISPPAVTIESKFLSLKAAAEAIGCTRRFLETRIEDGELTVFRPSTRLVRIRRSEFERWIDGFSAKGPALGASRPATKSIAPGKPATSAADERQDAADAEVAALKKAAARNAKTSAPSGAVSTGG